MPNSDIQKYVELKKIVGFFLDANDKSDGSFDKAWLLAFRGLVDLGFSMSFEPKTLRIKKNANQTVTLPPDYISWSKIGCMNGDGQVSTLSVNNSLSTAGDLSPNRISALAPDIPTTIGQLGLPILPYYLNFWGNGYYQPLFGLGGGLVQYGECRVDEKNNVIVLDVKYPFDEIVLEYLSSPEKDGDYKVELCCQEAIIAFIEWKFKIGSEQSYINRKIEANRSLKPFRIQDMQELSRNSVGFKVKC